ncbi:MAG: OsmC family protein [Alphaproteobacteria bacterium]|nr:OsmC family protein [Alphaproteobacteria bacterium]MBO6864104.1 OsmC family protein [Alphaproteobacteria bacterium]
MSIAVKDTSTKGGFAGTFDRIAADISDNPNKAIARFEVQSRQISGLHSEVEARDYLLTVDEPKALGGQDLGPNPIELVLAAIASCQEITYRLYADKLGIPLRGVSATVQGDIDLRGMFAIDPGARPGFRGLDIQVELDSDAPAAELDRLKRTVDAHCPVLDIIRNATPVAARTHRQPDGDEIAGEPILFAGLAG